MIIFYKKNSWKEQIECDISELLKYKESYNNKVRLFDFLSSTEKNSQITKKIIDKLNIEDRINKCKGQIQKIDDNLIILNEMLGKCNSSKKASLERKQVYLYNKQYDNIKNSFISNCLLDDSIILSFVEDISVSNYLLTEKRKKSKEIDNKLDINDKENNTKKQKNIDLIQEKIINNVSKLDKDVVGDDLENNDTLLISEKFNRVILPYTAKEVKKIFNSESNKYNSLEEVIEDNFVRDYSDYKFQFLSRYKETMKLAKEREGYGFTDSLALSTEMIGKRFLHPAIISACRSVYELDVYLDCLDKNELDDFKIFKIKFELYPMVVKQDEKVFEDLRESSNVDKINNIKETRKKRSGTRFKENSKTNVWNKSKRISSNAEQRLEC